MAQGNSYWHAIDTSQITHFLLDIAISRSSNELRDTREKNNTFRISLVWDQVKPWRGSSTNHKQAYAFGAWT